MRSEPDGRGLESGSHVRFKPSAVLAFVMLQDLRLTIVVENSASLSNSSVWAQHGLSIFLDLGFGPERMKLLLDTGASSEVMLHNADALGLDLSKIDFICLSHGHYDHTGGLMGILEQVNGRVCILAHPDTLRAQAEGPARSQVHRSAFQPCRGRGSGVHHARLPD